jgi:hypothetical protein
VTSAATQTRSLPRLAGRLARLSEVWLVLVVVLTRLPFISVGYGRDGDAWKTIDAAAQIAASGHYTASRLPGYPVVEYAYAALPFKTPLWANGITVLMTAAAAVLVFWLAREFRCQRPFLIAVAFAMTPVVYVASATSMDYLWALALALGCLLLAVRGLPLTSGVLLGLASGARLTSLAFILVAAPLIVTSAPGRRLRAGLLFAAGLAATLLLVWWPVVTTYGGTTWSFGEQSRTLVQTIAHGTVQLWGLVGLLGLVLVVVLEARGWFAGVRARIGETPPRDKWWMGGLIAVALVEALAFIRLPHEAGYLIPLVPLLLLLVGRYAGRSTVAALCICLIVSPFILNLDDYDFSRAGQDIRLAVAGPIFFDHDQRVFFERDAEQTLGLAASLPPGDVLLAGFWGAYARGLAAARPDSAGLRTRLFEGVSAAEVRRIQAAGGTVYYLPSAEGDLRAVWGLDAAGLGMEPLRPRP